MDLPERLSLMTRFLPFFRLMFRRYLWTGAGSWESGPAAISCRGEQFTFTGSLITDAWHTSAGTAMFSEYSQSYPEDLSHFRQSNQPVHCTSARREVVMTFE